jgi:hypothetical protein
MFRAAFVVMKLASGALRLVGQDAKEMRILNRESNQTARIARPWNQGHCKMAG